MPFRLCCGPIRLVRMFRAFRHALRQFRVRVSVVVSLVVVCRVPKLGYPLQTNPQANMAQTEPKG